MTRAEFIKFWSASRGPEYATDDGWKRAGHMERVALPCSGDCDFAACRGWIMIMADPGDMAVYAINNPQFVDWIPDRIRNSEEYRQSMKDWGYSWRYYTSRTPGRIMLNEHDEPYSTEGLLNGLYGSVEPGLLVYLRAYVDESGTHDGANHLLMGGHVSSIQKWKRFDREWKAALAVVGIDKIISKDLVRASGAFYKWPNSKFDALQAGTLKASHRLGGFGLTTRLDYADFDECYGCEPHPKKGRLDSAYGFCFRHWLWTIQNHAADLYANHSDYPKGIYVVLEGGAPNFGDAARVFQEMKAAPNQKIPLMGFADGDKKMPGIQLAGIQAHRMWQDEHKDQVFQQSPPGRPSLAEVRATHKEPMVVFRQKIDRAFLTEWKADLLNLTGAKRSKD